MEYLCQQCGKLFWYDDEPDTTLEDARGLWSCGDPDWFPDLTYTCPIFCRDLLDEDGAPTALPDERDGP